MEKYFREQLDKVAAGGIGQPELFQVTKGKVKTNWMTLCDESASVMVAWLREHYTIKEDKNKFGSLWGIDDIKFRALDRSEPVTLTDEQAIGIAELIERKHDANVGINWDFIDDMTTYYLED